MASVVAESRPPDSSTTALAINSWANGFMPGFSSPGPSPHNNLCNWTCIRTGSRSRSTHQQAWMDQACHRPEKTKSGRSRSSSCSCMTVDGPLIIRFDRTAQISPHRGPSDGGGWTTGFFPTSPEPGVLISMILETRGPPWIYPTRRWFPATRNSPHRTDYLSRVEATAAAPTARPRNGDVARTKPADLRQNIGNGKAPYPRKMHIRYRNIRTAADSLSGGQKPLAALPGWFLPARKRKFR